MDSIFSLKLRIYPNETQLRLINTYFRARQWAYHFGIAKNKEAWKLWREMVNAFPMYKKEIPYPKWIGSEKLSQEISKYRIEIELYNSTNEDKHPDSFLVEVPRCILTQGLMDYQKCLNKAFKDRKEKILPNHKMAGFPRFYAFHTKKTFRFQIDRPTTNQKHLETWSEGKIRLGDLVLRYKDPTKLPSKLPSLVTITQNACGQYFASFISSEPRTYQNPGQEERRKARVQKLEQLKQLSQKDVRKLAYDPNIQAEYYVDSNGQGFSLSEQEQVDKTKSFLKLIKQAKFLSKTQQGNKKKGIKPSKRSLKAKKKLAKVYLDRKNQRDDFNQKLTTTLAVVYAHQAREGLDVKEILEKNGKTKSRERNERLFKKYHISRSFSDLGLANRRSLMESKLNKYHGENHLLVTLDKFERTTQRCSFCTEERLVVKLGVKTWQCPYCQTIHLRDECAGQNILDKGFGITVFRNHKFKKSKRDKSKKPSNTDFSLTFPDLELDPRKGFPVVRTVGLDVGKRRRFVLWEHAKKDSMSKRDRLLFEKLASIGILRIAENIS